MLGKEHSMLSKIFDSREPDTPYNDQSKLGLRPIMGFRTMQSFIKSGKSTSNRRSMNSSMSRTPKNMISSDDQ